MRLTNHYVFEFVFGSVWFLATLRLDGLHGWLVCVSVCCDTAVAIMRANIAITFTLPAVCRYVNR